MPGTSSTARPGRITSSSARARALSSSSPRGSRVDAAGTGAATRSTRPHSATGRASRARPRIPRGVCAVPGAAPHRLPGGLAAVTGVPEAPLDRTENGLQAAGDGWFVVNARDAVWGESDDDGRLHAPRREPGCAFPAARLQHRRPLARPARLHVPPRAEPGGFPRRRRRVHSLRRGRGAAHEAVGLLPLPGRHRPSSWSRSETSPASRSPSGRAGEPRTSSIRSPSSARRARRAVEKETTDPKEAYAGMDVERCALQGRLAPGPLARRKRGVDRLVPEARAVFGR